MDCSLPGPLAHEIFLARILKWVVIPSSRGSSQPRNRTPVSCIGRQVPYHWTTRETQNTWYDQHNRIDCMEEIFLKRCKKKRIKQTTKQCKRRQSSLAQRPLPTPHNECLTINSSLSDTEVCAHKFCVGFYMFRFVWDSWFTSDFPA